MAFGDIPTMPATSGMEPFGILLDGFQPLALVDTSCRLCCKLAVFRRRNMSQGDPS